MAGILSALLCAVIWAVNYPAMKVALREMDPLAYTGWRFILASIILLSEALARKVPLLPPRGARGDGVLLALSGVGVYQGFYALGVAGTTGFSAALLNSTSPLMAGILVHVLGEERATPQGAAGTAVAWAGVILFLRTAHGGELGGLAGNLLSLAAAACWAIYSVAASRAPRSMPPLTAQVATFVGGSSVLIPYCLPAMVRQDYARIGALTLTILVLSAILPLALAFRLWTIALGSLGVARTTRFSFLIPVLAGVVSAIWTGEAFDAGKLAAAALVLAGLVVAHGGEHIPPRASEAGAG